VGTNTFKQTNSKIHAKFSFVFLKTSSTPITPTQKMEEHISIYYKKKMTNNNPQVKRERKNRSHCDCTNQENELHIILQEHVSLILNPKATSSPFCLAIYIPLIV
jgi:hypothetical protein